MKNAIEIKYSDYEKGVLLGSQRNLFAISGRLFIFFLVLFIIILGYYKNTLILPSLHLLLVLIIVIALSLTALLFFLDGNYTIFSGLFTGFTALCWISYFYDDSLKDFYIFDFICFFSDSRLDNLIIEAQSYLYYCLLNVIWYCAMISGSYFGVASIFFASINEESAKSKSFPTVRVFVRESSFVIESRYRFRLFLTAKHFKTIDFSQINAHDFGGGKYFYLNCVEKDGDSNNEIKKYKVRFSRKIDASTRSFLTHQIMKAQSVDKEN